MAERAIYRTRNVRWVGPAELAARTMSTLQQAVTHEPGDGSILLVDDTSARFNFGSAFGSLFPDAVSLWIGRGWRGEIVADLAAAQRQSRPATLRFQLTGDRITPLSSAPR